VKKMQFESNFPSLEDKQAAGLITAMNEMAHAETGFGVIEVVISMFLLGLMAIGFVPLLINSVRDTATNTTIATATQIVNQQIEGARAVRSPTATTPSCNDVTQFLSITLAPVVDPRGITLVPQWSSATCPTTYPGVVRAQVSVKKLNESTPIASAVTMIFVSSAA
jgi:type II secretory pathway pseudopilin PulG